VIQKSDKIWLDGNLVAWDNANIHVLTHTLHYGLGVFEGIRCYETKDKGAAIFRLDEHVRRLFESAHIFLIDIPYSFEILRQAVIDTVAVNGLKECYIRPIVFLGDGAMGLLSKDNPVRVAIAAWPWGAYLGEEGLTKGIKVKVSSYIRGHVNSNMSRAKVCGYYVNSQLAKREAVQYGFDEALLLDTEGYVSEGSGENIFVYKKGILKTTPLTSILDGITRDSVIQIAKAQGVTVKEERFTRDEVYIAEEAFFTGTAAEITPIRQLDGRTIGTASPGHVTKQIQSIFFNTVRGNEPDYSHWLTYL
jgi:branched-chain amino acid aminotransferase